MLYAAHTRKVSSSKIKARVSGAHYTVDSEHKNKKKTSTTIFDAVSFVEVPLLKPQDF